MCIGISSVVIALTGFFFINRTLVLQRLATEAATYSNRLSREAMIADQRPWVSVLVDLDGPLRWDVNGCNLSFGFNLTNTGRTPARFVSVNVQAVSLVGLGDRQLLQRSFADQVRTRRSSYGTTIFPGSCVRHSIAVVISNDEIERTRKWWKERNNMDYDGIMPIIFGCVNYFTTFDLMPHQTGFIFDIVRFVPIDNSLEIKRSIGGYS